jgi:hypothetical protein
MRSVVTLLLGAALVLGGCVTPATGPANPAPSNSVVELDSLTVAAPRPMTGYARDRFPHWRKVDENCDVRDEVLKRDGTEVQATRACKIVDGRWISPYDSKTLTDPQQVDIDHVVSLANGWRSGADTWTDERRADFANDLVRPQLRAVSRAANRAKGDQDPSQWRPPNQANWCDYAQRWITVKHYWGLTITSREKTALREMLGSCRPRSSTPPTSSPARAAS